jgi:hypothetical protein
MIKEQLPILIRSYAGIGGIPYQYIPFIRGFLAKAYFGITKTSQLIQQLLRKPNLRLLCGFEQVPSKATFPGYLPFFQNTNCLNKPWTG